jgi:hypothetical protein
MNQNPVKVMVCVSPAFQWDIARGERDISAAGQIMIYKKTNEIANSKHIV